MLLTDWVTEGALPSVDVLTLHLYWRQTEGIPEEVCFLRNTGNFKLHQNMCVQ